MAAGEELLTPGGPHAQADVLTRAALDPEHLGPKLDFDFFGTEDAPDFFRDVRILAAEELRPVLDDGDAAPEATVRLGEFEADVPAAEDDEALGQAVEFEQFNV